jgi:hypothetical protein
VLDAPPGHVGDVQQTVDATQIQEGAVIGQILDHALDLHALFQLLQQGLALGAVLVLDHRAAGDDHVITLAVQLDDLELEFLAFQVGGIAHRAHVHQGARQEGAHAVKLDGEATLDLAVDDALDGLAGLEGLVQEFPGRVALSLFAGQTGGTRAVLDRLQGDPHLIAHGTLQVAIDVEELGSGNNAFGLQARIDHHHFGGDRDHSAGDNGTGLQLIDGEALFKEFGKAFAHGLKVS